MASIDRVQMPGVVVSPLVGETSVHIANEAGRADTRQISDINWFLSEHAPDIRASSISVSPIVDSSASMDAFVSDILSHIGVQVPD